MAPRLAAGLLVLAGSVAACGGTPPGRSSAPPASTPIRGSTTSSVPVTAPVTVPVTTTTIDPGQLPQTADEPSDGAPLQARMQVLWQAIVDGSPDEALPLFFPESAYVSMKTGLLPDPAGDYADRLLAFYRLDIAAYHQLLGAGAGQARLTGVGVAAGDAAWIPPGSCENAVGYWHMPRVRLVYTVGTAVASFAVDSLISWRGTWYVVHLGPNPRPADVGTVDEPTSGPGVPGPAGGC